MNSEPKNSIESAFPVTSAPLAQPQNAVLNEDQKALEARYQRDSKQFVISDTTNMPGELVGKSGINPVAPSIPPGGMMPGWPEERVIGSKADREDGGGWVGKLARAATSKLMSAHPEELEAYKDEGRHEWECRGKFKHFQTLLSDWQVKMDVMEREIQQYKGVDIAQTLFQERFNNRVSFTHVIAGDPSLSVLVCLVMKKHGDEVLNLLKAEYAALQTQYRDFVKKERVTLQKLGLI